MTTLDSTPAPVSPPAPRIDPRLRQRWIDARREEGRRRLRLIVGMLAALALLGAGFAALHSPLLRVRHVRIALGDVPAGSDLTRAQVQAQAGLDRRRLMVNVSTAKEAQLVEALPWVATARVERDWPGTIKIAVTQRRPVAELDRVPGRPASGVAIVDATGRVLAVEPAGAVSRRSAPASGPHLPVLPLVGPLPAPGVPGTSILPPAGSGAQAGAGGQVAAEGRAAAEELAVAAALPAGLRRRVSTITITASGLQLRLGSSMVLFGDDGELAQKVASLETVLSGVSLVGVRTIDLRVPDRPALTDTQPGASLSTTAGG